jgi:hypothetical protein
MDIEDKLETELNGFISDDGKHEVGWLPWYDETTDSTYCTWICINHDKRYYVDCVFSAQV